MNSGWQEAKDLLKSIFRFSFREHKEGEQEGDREEISVCVKQFAQTSPSPFFLTGMVVCITDSNIFFP